MLCSIILRLYEILQYYIIILCFNYNIILSRIYYFYFYIIKINNKYAKINNNVNIVIVLCMF